MTDRAEKGLFAGEASGDRASLRLAIVGAPRSGNTWLRHMLRDLLDLEERSADFPDDIDWSGLPERCVIQFHWYPLEPFLRLIREHRFRVITPVRHPLDVLLSYLNYMFYAHQDGHCRGPGICNECAIVGVGPRSPAFLQYATGPRGRELLCYGKAWWKRPETIRIRYEDLVAQPHPTLVRLEQEIGESFRRPVQEILEATSISRRKPGEDFWQYHYWQGQPGLWRQMFTALEARAIASNVPEAFEAVGFACDADESLDPTQADMNWLRLQIDSIREHLTIEKSKHREKVRLLADVRVERDDLDRSLSEERVLHAATRRGLDEIRRQLEDHRRALGEARQALRLAEIRILSTSERAVRTGSIGPRLLKYARRVQEFATRGRTKDPLPAASRWLESRWEFDRPGSDWACESSSDRLADRHAGTRELAPHSARGAKPLS